jgi:hypothetical protein
LGSNPDKVLLSDASGVPVLAYDDYQGGRVAFMGGIAFADGLHEDNIRQLMVGLVDWLGECAPNRENDSLVSDDTIFPGFAEQQLLGSRNVRPELKTTVEGVPVFYNRITEAEALRVMAFFSPIHTQLVDIYGRAPTGPAKDVYFFSNTGSGWASAVAVGLPGLNDDPSGAVAIGKLGVLQHELTHSWLLPLGLSGHLLMNFNNYDLAKRYPALREHFVAVWTTQKARLAIADPDLTEIDLAVLPDFVGSQADRRRWEKWTWAFRVIRLKYGDGLFAELVELAESDGEDNVEDVQGVMYYLSLAAGENLYDWFESIGTTVVRRPLPGLPVANITAADIAKADPANVDDWSL